MNKTFLFSCFLSTLLTTTTIQTASQQDPFEAFIEEAFSAYPIDEKIIGGLEILQEKLLQTSQDAQTLKKLQTIRAILAAFKETSDIEIEITDILHNEALQAFKERLKILKLEEYLLQQLSKDRKDREETALFENMNAFFRSITPPASPPDSHIEIDSDIQKNIVNAHLLLLHGKLQRFILREITAQQSNPAKYPLIKSTFRINAQSLFNKITDVFENYRQTTHLILSQELLSKLLLSPEVLEALAQEIEVTQIATAEAFIDWARNRFLEQ